MFNYKTHSEHNSMYNTPPCYQIYICKLVLEWIRDEIGGLKKMKEINEKKAKILYDYLDLSTLFRGTVEKESRSLMNVPFVTGSEELDAEFVKQAAEREFVNLKGHRTVGGMRASIYNAMPVEGVEKLVEFMREFEEKHS
jgi:phosphoserine aminotransferase